MKRDDAENIVGLLLRIMDNRIIQHNLGQVGEGWHEDEIDELAEAVINILSTDPSPQSKLRGTEE